MGNTPVTYLFSEKKDYIPGAYSVGKITITFKDGSTEETAGKVRGVNAAKIRDGLAERILIEIQ